MALDIYALTTLEDVKSHLNIPISTITQDDTLERMINASSAKIEGYLDRKILKRTYTEYQDGRSSDRIVLKQWPIEKPTELWIDHTSNFIDVKNQLDSSRYHVEDDFGVQLIGTMFPRGRRNIKIVYQAGYDTVPYDIAEAAIMTVSFLYDMRSDRRIGVGQKGKNSENTTFLGELPEFVTNLLEPHKRMDFGILGTAVNNG